MAAAPRHPRALRRATRPPTPGARDGMPREQVPEGCELVIVLGGDGTLLSAARAIGGREIPLFPVNLGGLGFLTAITIDEIYPGVGARLSRRASRRQTPHAALPSWSRGERDVSPTYEALNDVVITKAAARPHDRSGRLRRRSFRLRL